MDLGKLHIIDEGLTKSEVAALKFLCLDVISRKSLETVKDAKDLFIRLDEQTLLKDPFLAELLYTIGRYDLLGYVETTEKEVISRLQIQTDSNSQVSPYRKMLYKLSEDVTRESLRSIKFFVYELPKAKREESATFLDVLTEMEKMKMLGKDNLDKLENILYGCDKQLASQVQNFKNEQRAKGQDKRSQEDTQGVVTDAESSIIAETREESINTYSLRRQPRGYCLIINNYNFENARPLLDREGTHRDVEALTQIFSKLHFNVVTETDLESSDMLNVTKKFAEEIHLEYDAFICCILSHGLKGTIVGTDGKEVPIHDLTQPFAKCYSLLDKPKVFFIQACQGNNFQMPMYHADGNEEEKKEEEVYEEDAQAVQLRSIPFGADFLIAMATVEFYKSFRHIHNGSIFIQELCRQLEIGLQRKEDILSVLTNVNREVSFQFLNGRKQMPEPRYTLTKKLVFTLD